MQQISPNVYVETQYTGCNTGFVTTSEGIVMIDTPFLPTDAMDWRKKIQDRGEIRFVVNTEHHTDHIAGNTFFPGIFISHHGVKEMLLSPLEQYMTPASLRIARGLGAVTLRDFLVCRHKELDPEGVALAGDYQVKTPTVTFSEQMTISLGRHDFILAHLPGHTPFQIGVYIPQEKVLFTGDNVTNGFHPSFAQSLPQEWVSSLQKVLEWDIDYVVPGHGESGNTDMIRQMAAFIEGCIILVQKAIDNGLNKEEAAGTISFEHLLKAYHPGAEQQRYDTMRIYEMLMRASHHSI